MHENNSPQQDVDEVSVSNGTTELPVCNGVSSSQNVTTHLRISEGQLDEVVANLNGRPREEVVRTLLDLAGRRERQPGEGFEVEHNPKDQFEGLIGLLRLKSLRRDSRNFNFIVEEVEQAFWKVQKTVEPRKQNPLTRGKSSLKPVDPEGVSHENLGTLVIDQKGSFWKWDCGWWVVDRAGRRVSTKPIGHQAFNRIPKATRLALNTHEIQVARPYGEWRRWCNDHVFGTPTLFYHEVYKHVRVLASDGVHAVIRNYYLEDSPKKEVFFSSLTELKMSETKKSMVHKEKKERRVKGAETLVITDELLKSLLA